VAASASGITYSGDAIVTTCDDISTAVTSDGCTYTVANNVVVEGQGQNAKVTAAGTKTVDGTDCAVW